jgi:hypothetical protein
MLGDIRGKHRRLGMDSRRFKMVKNQPCLGLGIDTPNQANLKNATDLCSDSARPLSC